MRTANHLAITDTGKVHYADDAKHAPFHILLCTAELITPESASVVDQARRTNSGPASLLHYV